MSKIYYDYIENESIEINEDDEDEKIHWILYSLKKLLEEVEGEKTSG